MSDFELIISCLCGLIALLFIALSYIKLRQNTKLLEPIQELKHILTSYIGFSSQEKSTNSNILINMHNLISDNMKIANNRQSQQITEIYMQLHKIMETNDAKLTDIKHLIDRKLQELARSNEEKLEQMRIMVDEKLHDTLEKRLSTSFQIVNDRLESVYKGLGEMQDLASGVGDLKKVLANVKTRGIWGEVQLEAIIQQIMTSSQYEKNVGIIASSQERVDFAIKVPALKDIGVSEEYIWLPIDAKCPLDDYHKLVALHDDDPNEREKLLKSIISGIKKSAKSISTKYIKPPTTTDFAIMFIPIEGMYAEILKDSSIIELLQSEYRVILTSPTTLSAILCSLQMGFRTLAIERRSQEVWNTLGLVRREFVKFSALLTKTRAKLEQASKAIGDAEAKSHAIHSKLINIEFASGDEISSPEDDNNVQNIVNMSKNEE